MDLASRGNSLNVHYCNSDAMKEAQAAGSQEDLEAGGLYTMEEGEDMEDSYLYLMGKTVGKRLCKLRQSCNRNLMS